MQRIEAMEILAELVRNCEAIDGQYLALTPPNPQDKLSQGYQIRIKNKSKWKRKEMLRKHLNRHKLARHETEKRQSSTAEHKIKKCIICNQFSMFTL